MPKLLALLFFTASIVSVNQLSLADDGNGVERGGVDYAEGNPIPSYVRKYLDHLIFTSCDLVGARSIEPNFQTETSEFVEIGLNAVRYRVEFVVNYKHGKFKDFIYVDVTGFTTGIATTNVTLNQLESKICENRKN